MTLVDDRGVELDGDGFVEIAESRGQEIRLRISAPRTNWERFGSQWPVQMRGSSDGGRTKWTATQVTPIAWDCSPLQWALLAEVSELERVGGHEESGDRPASFHTSAWLSRGSVLPRPVQFDPHSNAVRYDLAPIEIGLRYGTVNVASVAERFDRVGGVAGPVLRDHAIVTLQTTLRPSTENREAACRQIREIADDVSAAVSLLSAEMVAWTRLDVVLITRERIVEHRVYRTVRPLPKLPGAHSVVHPSDLPEVLPKVLRLLDGADADSRRHFERVTVELAGACADLDPLVRLRYAMTALDVLGAWQGDGEVCNKARQREVRQAIDAALRDRFESPIVDAASRAVQGELLRSMHARVSSLVRKLRVPHDGLFGGGLSQVVRVRNMLMHTGSVPAEVATPGEWMQISRDAVELAARAMLRACGVDVWQRGAWWPVVELVPRHLRGGYVEDLAPLTAEKDVAPRTSVEEGPGSTPGRAEEKLGSRRPRRPRSR